MLNIQQHIPLAPFTTFHIGGPADYFVQVSSTSEVIEAVQWAKNNNMPFFILGTGANILVGDKGYRGLVIKNESSELHITEDNMLIVDSGVTVEKIIQCALEKGLSGFEHFAGITSSVGGALWQNLHFLTPERDRTFFIEEIVESASVYTENGENKQVGKDYFRFAYDWSILHEVKDIVLSATFRLHPENPEELKKRADANVLWRKEKHPENAARCSAGSVFKKLEGHGAGRLIEQVGLKGKQLGGAQISQKHANFIINTGNATAADVRELIAFVQDTVKTQLGLHLETEISFVGEF